MINVFKCLFTQDNNIVEYFVYHVYRIFEIKVGDYNELINAVVMWTIDFIIVSTLLANL